MNQQITNNIVVIYHADCADGFSSAWVAWKKFGESANYISSPYDTPLPEGLEGKEVYLLDYTYSKELMTQLVKISKRVVVIDHHLGAEENAQIAPENIFDSQHSGAVLTWQYFYPDKSVPKFLLYIEDADLWKFNFSETIALSTYADLYLDSDFETWAQLSDDCEDDKTRTVLIAKGEVLVKYRESIMEKIFQQKQRVLFEGYEVYAVNGTRTFRSEVAARLAKTLPPFGLYWYQERDRIHVSLRSVKGVFDVSELAKKFNGNGHPSSAGFFFPAGVPFPWKIINEK